MAIQKIHLARPLNQPEGFCSPVDIVIPFHGHYDGVTRLLESIFHHTRTSPCRIYLVDDGSNNSDYGNMLAKVPGLKCVRHETQRGFGASLQTGFLHGQNPWVLFMNSDCQVEDAGWLRGLGQSLLRLKDKKVRMVSARTNNPVNGDDLQRGEKGDGCEDRVLETGFLSLYCFLCHRELFQHVGGFIKPYPYGGYEDEEFAWRMRANGYLQGVSGSSWVRHEGEATIKELWRKSHAARKIMVEENRQRCLADIHSLQGA